MSHPNYPHAGPGPSSYYQQPPPPSHVYGTQSPGPRPNYYPYSVPPPPHTNSHQPVQYHQQGPSRGAYRGPYNPRGAHNYHNYAQPHQQPHYPHSHVNPALGHPQYSPQQMYSPQSAKYNPPFTPSYPSPTAPVFTPSWQTQQALSPLPKQLSMPQPFYEPPPAEVVPTPITPAEEVSTAEIPIDTPAENLETPSEEIHATSSPEIPHAQEFISLPSSEELDTSTEKNSAPSPTLLPQTSSYSQMGTIFTSESISPPVSRSASPSPRKAGVWAIWSRRPQDPSQAPGIIISPKARPPPDVVQQALDLKTPPPSLPTSPILIAKLLPAVQQQVQAGDLSIVAWASQTNSSVPSSSVTENADTPTIPGSPASSHTSLSVGTKEQKNILIQPVEANPVIGETPVTADPAVDAEAAPAVPAEIEEAKPDEADPSPAPAEMLAGPILVPQPIATPAPKKSWASLLRPASSTSSSGPSRNTLPTSSVIGFSVPAVADGPAASVSPSYKSELLALLTAGPPAPATGFAAAAAGATSGAAMRIRPRGLVNSGNMCFANAVLQVLVYCPPFHRLFAELGKVLVGPAVAVKDDASATPLVDATVEFLREFVDDKRRKDKSRLEVVNRTGANGKGKEKEVREENENEEDWDGDSFLPTYIYDAMKAKKRFDNMRGGHQEDAEEFFGFYLDTLEEELLSMLHSLNPPKASARAAANAVEEREEAAPPEDDGWLEVGKRNRMVVTRTIKATESPITRIFGGKFRSTLRAPGQKDSVVVEDWRSLRLDIQREQIHTIQDALSYISHPQPVQLTQSARPGVTVEAQQQVLIESLPPILVLHIKRFCYDTSVNGVVKVGKQVRFGPELEIGSDVMISAAKKSQPTRYKLFGALYHHGLSASGGHYTLDVLHPNRYPNVNPSAKPREGWVRIDDDLVSDVRPEDVFGATERDDARCAYLLFYRRI
ncbi:hypothetical protein HYPSUDRAFT_65703 [Hypholoma sublateritium FD-334 SS-4]|uniref:ubiquitinyl hydrolase 1 n=1 Tax=Hypholoma sublateritium (strain FD-334 SS-4) TaxID=945553 RepID=A0A0D2NZY2_HYPSF|nr:hypothetical protein HYPSUDRAFT_65703 [Hypholoma sublateritium FD-334 SS-4]